MENRQYKEMLAAATARLNRRDPGDIAARTGAEYDPAANALRLNSFGQRYDLECAGWQATPEMEMWHHLTLLQYLDAADGSLPGDRWIGMAELTGGGQARGASFDREVDGIIARRLGAHLPEVIHQAFLNAGGVLQPSGRADLSAVFFLAPRYPMLLNLWFADDEFPASGKVLLNDATSGCLGLEAAGTAAALLLRRLSELCETSSLS